MPSAIIVGTGRIGIACALHLREQGWAVRTLGRSAPPAVLGSGAHAVVDRHDGPRFAYAIGDGDLLLDTIAFDAADAVRLASFQHYCPAIATLATYPFDLLDNAAADRLAR